MLINGGWISALQHQRQPASPVERAGIKMRQPQFGGQCLGQRTLPRRGGAVNRNDHGYASSIVAPA